MVFVIVCDWHLCEQRIPFNKKRLLLRKLLEQDRGICCAVLLTLASTPIIGNYLV